MKCNLQINMHNDYYYTSELKTTTNVRIAVVDPFHKLCIFQRIENCATLPLKIDCII